MVRGISFSTQASSFFNGTWQGLKVRMGQPNQKGMAYWVEFKVDESTNEITGESREEYPFTKNYALKSIKGKVISDHQIEFNEVMFGNKKNSGKSYWCLINGTLTYNDSTGYLTGDFLSKDCRAEVGHLTLYKSRHQMSKTDTVSLYHSWVNNFIGDLSRGWAAYYVRDAEMRNFEFKPVYFDHDKDELKPEYYSYLKDMVRIVQSHTDLRIKIIGHTDSNGTDEYNINLSERRADNVKAFLVSLGIKPDKVVIEFRGESDPAASNATSKGKQLNRRVDFEFI